MYPLSQTRKMFFHISFVLSLLTALSLPVLAVPAPVAGPDASVTLVKRDISQALYDDLYRYVRYSAATHRISCPNPLGNTRILQVRCNEFDNCPVFCVLFTNFL